MAMAETVIDTAGRAADAEGETRARFRCKPTDRLTTYCCRSGWTLSKPRAEQWAVQFSLGKIRPSKQGSSHFATKVSLWLVIVILY